MKNVVDLIGKYWRWLLFCLSIWILLRLALDLSVLLTPLPVLQEVAVPAGQFVGGMEALSPGKVVDMTAFVPNAKSTPVAVLQTVGEVRGVLSADTKAVVLALPAAAVPTLEVALLNENTKLTYHLLSAWPTATPTLTATPTPTPTATLAPGETATITPTPMPASNKVYWTLSLEKNRTPLDGITSGAALRLVILAELSLSSGEGTVTPPTAFSACIRLVDFLDATGSRLPAIEPENVRTALIEISAAQLPNALLNLKYGSDIYLILDQSCEE